MKNPLISFVVPIYNVERYLHECVESLINQTYKNIEIILVDDGSPDNCPMTCDDYAKNDSRIKVIHKENGGLVSARKAGVNIANGDYVACVDGDDFVTLNMADKIRQVIEKYDCDVVCFGFFKDDETYPEPINFEYGYYNKDKLVNQIYPYLIEHKTIKYFPNNLCGKACKTNLYLKEQNKVDNRIKIGEDLACTKPIISKAKNMYIMEDCLYYYRTNMQSMTKNKKAFYWEVPELIYNHLKTNLDESYDFEDQLYRSVSHHIFNVAVSQFYRKDISKKEIKKDIKTHLNNGLYKECVQKAKYSSLKGKFMIFALKHKSFFLMKLYLKLIKR